MSKFKDYYKKDIDTVLLNTDEKAEEMLINGETMTVIIDDDKLSEMKNKSQYADAIYNAELLLFVRKQDLGYRPAVESTMTVDEHEYQVALCSGDHLLQIILRAVE